MTGVTGRPHGAWKSACGVTIIGRKMTRNLWLAVANLGIVLLLSAACGSDDDGNGGSGGGSSGGNRFDGKTEMEMFEIVRESLCNCVVESGSMTKADCITALDDPSAYQSPIDAATREKLDKCLDVIDASDCSVDAGAGVPPECTAVESYLDLK